MSESRHLSSSAFTSYWSYAIVQPRGSSPWSHKSTGLRISRGVREHMPVWLSYISVFCTVAGVSIVVVYRWLRTHSVVFSVHDPAKPVSGGRLSYPDVQRGLGLLLDDARQFKPDLIMGINRGGAIVGSCLAKQMNIPWVYLLSVNCDNPGPTRVVENRADRSPLRGKVLLVDDALRKGEHMREATEYLRRKYPGIEIRRMVLLKMTIPHLGAEQQTFRNVTVEKAAFETHDASVLLPWD